MAKDRQINTFYKGLNKDLGKSVLNSEQYLDARNCRLVSDSNNESLELSNIKGNKLSFSIANYAFYKFPIGISTTTSYSGNLNIEGDLIAIPAFTPTSTYNFFTTIRDFLNNNTDQVAIISYDETDNANDYLLAITSREVTSYFFILNGTKFSTSIVSANNVIGYGNIREKTYLFTTDSDEETPTDTNGAIWEVTYNDTTAAQTPTLTLLYANPRLNFSTYYPIESYGNYETTSIQKLYWWDNNNYLRHINLGSSTFEELAPTQLDIITEVNLTKPKLVDILIGGNFNTGVVQYSYQLYNTNGTESIFSPVSNLIHLAPSSESGGNSSSYYGGALDEDVKKSIQCTIEDIDNTFDYIKIVSVYWTSLDGLPEITIIKDMSLEDNTTITFTDGHIDSLGEYTLEEFTVLGGLLITPKTCAVKNDILFTGNIKETYFDIDDTEFDARAYRFPDSSTSTSYDGVSINQSNWDSALEVTADCIGDDPTTQLYKEDSQVIGGEGPNISYEIGLLRQGDAPVNYTGILGDAAGAANYKNLYSTNTNEEHYEWTDQGLDNDNGSFGNYASPFNSGLIRGYQRGETYRFGIVFYDKYGRSSFTKWIGDIKMPEIYDTSKSFTYYNHGTAKYDFTTAYYDADDDRTYFNILYVKFDVSIPVVVSEKISGYKIVRVKRESYDRNILGQGILGITDTYYEAGVYRPNFLFARKDYFTDGSVSNKVLNFFSPEINFNKNIICNQEDTLNIIGYIPENRVFYTGGTVACRKFSDIQSQNISSNTISDGTITDAGSKTQKYGIGETYINYAHTTVAEVGYQGTCLTVNLEEDINLTSLLDNTSYLFVNYKRILENQYGGNKYINRRLNEYISTGDFVPVNTTSIFNNENIVFGGDTFIAFYDYLKIMRDNSAPAERQMIGFFPVETSINLPLRHDKSFSRDNDNTMLQETMVMGIDQFGTDYSTDKYTDLYLYNTVYSKEDDINTYFPKPLNFNDEEDFDTRIYYSSSKTNGEIVDSWLKMLPNNFSELKASYGQLNKLQIFKNNLYAFQESAVAVLSVNKEVLLQTESPVELSLGTGGVLSRYDYITTDSGTKHKYSVITSPNAIYYFDVNKKKLYRLTNKDEPISDIKGLKSYLDNLIKGPIYNMDNPGYYNSAFKGGINGYYDPRYNEVAISLSTVTNEVARSKLVRETVIFSELNDSFIGFADFTSPIYIPTENKILSISRDEGDDIYIQNEGDYGSFFGTVYDSTLEYLVNKGYTESKAWDSIEFVFEAYDSDDIEQYSKFFEQIRCHNGYQNSDYITLIFKDKDSSLADSTEAFVTRRERGWSLQVPRNMVSQNITTIPLKSPLDNTVLTNTTRKFKERLRSKYLIVDLVYDNDDNNKMVLSLVQTNFRVSQR